MHCLVTQRVKHLPPLNTLNRLAPKCGNFRACSHVCIHHLMAPSRDDSHLQENQHAVTPHTPSRPQSFSTELVSTLGCDSLRAGKLTDEHVHMNQPTITSDSSHCCVLGWVGMEAVCLFLVSHTRAVTIYLSPISGHC